MKNPFVFAGFCLLIVAGCSRTDGPNSQTPKRSEVSTAQGKPSSIVTTLGSSQVQETTVAPSNAPLTPPNANHFLLGKKEGSANSSDAAPNEKSNNQSIVMPPPVPPQPKVPPREPMAGSSPWIPPGTPVASDSTNSAPTNLGLSQNPLRSSAVAGSTNIAATGLPRGRITGLSPNPFRAAPVSDSDPGETGAFITRSLYSAATPPTPPSPGPSIDDRAFVPNVPQTSPQIVANTQLDTSVSAKSGTENSAAFVASTPIKATGSAHADKPKHKHQLGNKLPPSAHATENSLVKVFYATDRKIVTAAEKAMDYREYLGFLFSGLVVVSLVVGSTAIARGQPPHSVGVGLTVVVCFLAIGYTALTRISERVTIVSKTNNKKIEFGSERGDLQLGICEVSIPKTHQVGKLESPSIFRIEFSEDKDRHIVLERTVQKTEEEFYRQVQNKVNKSPRKDLFVFIHGYNETFEDAARRTAQMALDLSFEGAPVFYSWPSKGDLLGYSYDENNVAWTVPHLKKFLLNLAKNSDAKAVNLIAHSMGNRALTSALKELALEVRSEKALYNEVILAAPDIDADTFKNDIAPYVAKSANRVTLYASSRDKALEASQLVHGYPRAGDSGDRLVVIAGIDTVDVSAIDTTLLGHTYISGNEPIIHDLGALLHDVRDAALRPWLKMIKQDNSSYWVFTHEATTASLASPPK